MLPVFLFVHASLLCFKAEAQRWGVEGLRLSQYQVRSSGWQHAQGSTQSYAVHALLHCSHCPYAVPAAATLFPLPLCSSCSSLFLFSLQCPHSAASLFPLPLRCSRCCYIVPTAPTFFLFLTVPIAPKLFMLLLLHCSDQLCCYIAPTALKLSMLLLLLHCSHCPLSLLCWYIVPTAPALLLLLLQCPDCLCIVPTAAALFLLQRCLRFLHTFLGHNSLCSTNKVLLHLYVHRPTTCACSKGSRRVFVHVHRL